MDNNEQYVSNFHLELYLTRDCNLRCNYCFEGHHGKGASNASKYKMSYETADKSLDFIFKRIRKPQFDEMSITFFGGEVMQDMNSLISFTRIADEYSKVYDFPITKLITTNGSFLNKKNYEILQENDISYLISLDGNKETHDMHRVFGNGRGSFDLIWRNKPQILKGIESGLCIKCLITVTPEMVPHLFEATKFLIDQGFKKLLYNFAMDKFCVWDEKVLNVLKDIIPKIMEYAHISSADIYPLNYLQKQLSGEVVEDYSGDDLRCGVLTEVIAIDCDGTILPCTRFSDGKARKLAVGNVWEEEYNKPLIDFLVNIRRNVNSKCNSCSLKKTCITYCPMIAADQTTLFEPPKVMCDLNFTLHEIISEHKLS